MQTVNICRAQGILKALKDGKGIVRTIEQGADRKKYETDHLVDFSDIDVSNLKVGGKVDVVGPMYQNPGEYAVWVRAVQAEKRPRNAEYVNHAKVIGRAVRSYQHRVKAGSQSFGNILLTDGKGGYFRGTAWNEFSSILEVGKGGAEPMPPLKKGAIVQLEGAIRKRPFNDNITTSIIADEDLTRVLVAGEVNNPLAGIAMAATPAEYLTASADAPPEGLTEEDDGLPEDVF